MVKIDMPTRAKLIREVRNKMSVPKARSGRRSISVSKLLAKEKDGTLYKPEQTKVSAALDEARDQTLDAIEKIAFGPEDMAKVLKIVKGKQLKGVPGIDEYAAYMPKKKLQVFLTKFTPERRRAFDQEFRNLHGKISTPKRGDAAQHFRSDLYPEHVRREARELRPHERKALDAIIKGHELDELKVKSSPAFKRLGHDSPDVILREHNRVTTLPKDHEGVRRVARALRLNSSWLGQDQEAEILRKEFGLHYGNSPRLSRHARKRMVQILERPKPKKVHPMDALVAKKDKLIKDLREKVKSRLPGFLKKSEADYGKNSAGFDLQGHTTVQGLPIAIENRPGSTRTGKNDDGSTWSTTFKSPYGYIEGTHGADGEEIDAYVGPDKDSTQAYVVHQKKGNGSHDEDTVMLGYSTKGDAKTDILRHYDDTSLIGGIDSIAIEALKAKLEAAKGKKISKLADAATFTAPEYNDAFTPGTPEAPTPRPKKIGDVPSRAMEDPYPAAKVESRADNLEVRWAGNEMPHDGNMGKWSNAVHCTDVDQIRKLAFVRELKALGAVTPSMLQKIAREITDEGAADAAKTLKRLEDEAPTAGAAARGALVGAGVGPAANLAWRVAAGAEGRAGKPVWLGKRVLLANLAQGATLGGLLPLARYKVETEAHKQTLRNYIKDHERGKLTKSIKQNWEL